jgi:hypothetical protein
MTIDDLPRAVAVALAAGKDNAEARLFESGYGFDEIEIARTLMNDVNTQIAAAVRDLIPEIRDQSADAQATAITDAAAAACEEVLRRYAE